MREKCQPGQWEIKSSGHRLARSACEWWRLEGKERTCGQEVTVKHENILFITLQGPLIALRAKSQLLTLPTRLGSGDSCTIL